MTKLILALDQGTTGSTAAFFDATSLTLLGNSKREFPQIYPKPGLVEHDADEIWKSMLLAIEEAWKMVIHSHPHHDLKDLLAVGITNQRETVVPWNKRTGELAGNAIVWQDRRTAKYCEKLKARTKIRRDILKKTGLVCDPYFSASKMKWILDNYPKARAFHKQNELVLGTVDSYLIYKLTGGERCVTDDTNASRTMLYNLRTGRYDKDLCKLFGIPESVLPTILPSAGLFGNVKGVSGIPDGTPITGCLGDQQAALFGHDCRRKGEGKITYGTGAFILVNTGNKPVIADNGILATVAYSSHGVRTFAVEGSAFIAGAAVQFLRDNFQWVEKASQSEALALSEPRDPHVLFVPAFTGLGAPYWNPHAQGALFGLTRGTKKAQIVRAVLESIALQNVQILKTMQKGIGSKIKKLGVDGGASRSDMLMQFQADVCRTKLMRPHNIESTAKGAAKAALYGLGESKNSHEDEAIRTFTPQLSAGEAVKISSLWDRAARCVDKFYR